MAARKPPVRVDDRGTRAALDRFADRLDDLPTTAGEPAASAVALRASQIAPRVSGALADDIRVELEGEIATVVAGSARVPYARVIHDGWPARNIVAQPFLADALADERDAGVLGAYDRAVDDLVRRFDLETPP